MSGEDFANNERFRVSAVPSWKLADAMPQRINVFERCDREVKIGLSEFAHATRC